MIKGREAGVKEEYVLVSHAHQVAGIEGVEVLGGLLMKRIFNFNRQAAKTKSNTEMQKVP